MLRYKNIVFDFGNVIADFDVTPFIKEQNISDEDVSLFYELTFKNWRALDEGAIDYDAAATEAYEQAPSHLKESVKLFFQEWYKYLPPLYDTWELIRELKAEGASLYILSNAPIILAEHADFFEITKEFDGIAFSAPVKLAKPGSEYYQYLFDTYHLNPSECFFIDDTPICIEAGQALGMDGIVFDGDVSKVRERIYL